MSTPAPTPQRYRSTVKSWYEPLRYGLIAAPSDYAQDFYVNFRSVPFRLGIGTRLVPGEVVEFELWVSELKLHRSNPATAKLPIAANITFPAPI